MPKSILDLHAVDLLLRRRRGYTQRMLILYLLKSKNLRYSQPNLSRWLSRHQTGPVDLPPDEEYREYQKLAALGLTLRRYRRTLSSWRGHIEHLRQRGASLGDIQADLQRRGVSCSIRSIRRELEAQ